MKTTWTIAHIENLKKEGKIVGYTVQKKEAATEGGRKVAKHFKKANPAKDFIANELLAWCQERKIILHEEYNFNPLRRWRADWCIMSEDPRIRILVEYEGLSARKTNHTTSAGYTANAEKYNSAAGLGWTVLRFTYLNYESLITELNKHI